MLNLGFYRRRGYVETERTVNADGVPVVIMERVRISTSSQPM